MTLLDYAAQVHKGPAPRSMRVGAAALRVSSHLAAAAVAAGFLWHARLSPRGAGYYSYGAMFEAGFFVAPLYLAQVLLWAARASEYHEPPGAIRREIVHWLAGPLVLLVCMVLAGLSVPFRLAFSWSEQDLEHMARHAQAHPEAVFLDARAGTFRIEATREVAGGGTGLLIARAGTDFAQGVAFCPHGAPPPHDGRFRYTRIGGDWYFMSEGP